MNLCPIAVVHTNRKVNSVESRIARVHDFWLLYVLIANLIEYEAVSLAFLICREAYKEANELVLFQQSVIREFEF